MPNRISSVPVLHIFLYTVPYIIVVVYYVKFPHENRLNTTYPYPYKLPNAVYEAEVLHIDKEEFAHSYHAIHTYIWLIMAPMDILLRFRLRLRFGFGGWWKGLEMCTVQLLG